MVVPEADKKPTAPELVEARAKIENNLTKFSKRLLGEANRYIALIEDRQVEIDRLEAGIELSAQGLGQLETEFGHLGGWGKLTPQIIDRAEIAHHSYLIARRNFINQFGSRSHEACPDCSNHPGLVTDSVGYQDFLLYGILQFKDQSTNGAETAQATDQTIVADQLTSSSVQTLPITPLNNKTISQDEEQMVAYIPSHDQPEFQRLKQDEDLTSSLLLAGPARPGLEAYDSPAFDLGAYGLGNQLEPNSPVVKQLLKSAAAHLDLKRNSQTKIDVFKSEVSKTRWALRGLNRKIPV